MTDFSRRLKDTLNIYWKKAGVDPNALGGFFRRLQDFGIEVAEKQASLERFSKILNIIVKATPIVGATCATILYNLKYLYTAIAIGVTTVIIYLVLIFLEAFLPKDLASLKITARSIALENALNILASQIIFYANLQKISHDDNDERIQKLSDFLDKQLTDALQKNWTILKDVTNTHKYNNNIWASAVSVTDIPDKIYNSLTPIAEMIAEACTFIFGPAKYTVKIYLRTKHLIQDNVDSREVEMLTSLVKYPRPLNHYNTSGGRSWVKCQGRKSLVWECVDQEIICKKNEQKRQLGNEQYPSIVFIKLPEGIGVLTIESSEESTFSNSEKITEDVRQTLMVATNVLVREALNESLEA